MTTTNNKSAFRQLAGKLLHLPGSLFQLLKGKAEGAAIAVQMADEAQPPVLSPGAVLQLEQSLKLQLYCPSASAAALSAEETAIIAHIRELTRSSNRNNATRTGAYWHIYESHKELHWALLAHMVSRNGGWCMTDLKGDLLPQLLNAQQAEHMFLMLERSNALIFQDAYPQLLLYAESKRRNRSMFHLLPHLNISAFMHPVWQQFWQKRDSALLTVCLIINEQNYIEKRIIQDPAYSKSVLDSMLFKSQWLLQLNQVFFPYSRAASPPRLAGLILEYFSDLQERIEFGKKLYALLFGLPKVHQGALAFASRQAHTGSRSDYWPQLFSPAQKAPPEPKFKERLSGCELMKGADPFYSPPLAEAWKDRELGTVTAGDWFVDLGAMRHVSPVSTPIIFDITAEACLGLNKIELAIAAEQVIHL